jgi:GT2 family glycosyltransferase
MTSRPPVSVVIAARNAADTIERQLEALRSQDYAGELEVVIADNGSTDATRARVLAWTDRLPGLRVVDAAEVAGAAHARNVGIGAATNEIVVVCDADDVVAPHWIELLVDALSTSDLVTGGVVVWDGGAFPATPDPYVMGTAGFGFLPILSTGCLGLHRSAWQALGGFDETLVTCEDVDFAWRAQLRGYTLELLPDAFVYYRVIKQPGVAFRKAVEYGRFQPMLYRRYRGAGFRRQPLHRALARWGILILTAYHLAGSDTRRRRWCVEFGRRWGRLIGSIEARAAYL